MRFQTAPKFSRYIYKMMTEFLQTVLLNESRPGLPAADGTPAPVKPKTPAETGRRQAHSQFMIALGEAVDNAVMHGNKMDADKYIDVECEVAPDRITCHIQDEGDGFNPKRFMDAPLQDFEHPALMKKVAKYGTPGSMGIAMMRKCLSEIKFGTNANGGTRLTMVKNL
jgi:anti-sigma regulatory factor (Ser/Thr protein kinase)